jgi:hypothetical protein
VLRRKPTTGIAAGCAPSGVGQANGAAALPRRVKNSRRLM